MSQKYGVWDATTRESSKTISSFSPDANGLTISQRESQCEFVVPVYKRSHSLATRIAMRIRIAMICKYTEMSERRGSSDFRKRGCLKYMVVVIPTEGIYPKRPQLFFSVQRCLIWDPGTVTLDYFGSMDLRTSTHR